MALLYNGIGVLAVTIEGDGKVVCSLDNMVFYYTVAATHLTGLTHLLCFQRDISSHLSLAEAVLFLFAYAYTFTLNLNHKRPDKLVHLRHASQVLG